MRRKEREITDRKEIDQIISLGKVMHLALSDNNLPFLIPVFYAYDGTSLYFHSAKAGTKIDILKRNNNVCFEISVDNGIVESDMACDFEAKHRTIIGFGKAQFVESEDDKIAVLDRIVSQFTDKKFEYPKGNLHATAVIRIDIESIKGKKHGV
ncbi:pyridoxamine 5'-phosphate oxidase family protein [Dysgonomonas capnocytophagoides]|uniref:Pyridoxamine 5'-phosphate oxidase family protein n=2 Tax=Dysgonomonas capnocytophagoides TaxID=45254 RepID=A0A4Y8KYF2_9BACT|nr:pyridoxamine 5'-phosphate oxidase family protein [Dysgonomonas capnocytophagoides]TFD94689.1 pyridoxamine 5'-phosphate oxidase family protein [Dysgonomonas capnocytophagoides]